jgi:superfamily II DNA or RNA helicase
MLFIFGLVYLATRMSVRVKFSDLDEEEKFFLATECVVKPKKNQYCFDPPPIPCFSVNTKTDAVYIPLAMWTNYYDAFPFQKKTYPKTKITSLREPFTKATDPKKYRDQDVVFLSAVDRLERQGCVFLSLNTGFGKTFLGCHLACYLKLKTAVICHLSLVNDQWVSEFEKYTTARVQRIKGDKGLDPTADVYIIGVKKSSMMSREDFIGIGTVIVDEAHMVTMTTFSKSLQKFTPRYLIGLSATPTRDDGLHKIFPLFFGPAKQFIVRTEIKDFTVIKMETHFQPKTEYRFVQGSPTLAWDIFVGSLEKNPARQQIAVELACRHSNEHRILILCHYIAQSTAIYNELVKREQNVELLVGAKKTWNSGCQILVAGTKKAGVGFNDPTLTMLILMSPTKRVAQFEGRIRTNNNIIYDLVDDSKILENHWRERERWYNRRGASIRVVSTRESEEVAQVRFLPPNAAPETSSPKK